MFLFAVALLFAGSAVAAAPSMDWFVGYGTSDGAHVHEGMRTSDGGYIAIAHTLARVSDMVVSKIDSSGSEEWTVTVGDSRRADIGICVAEASDGFICGGGLYDSSSRGQERGLVKLNKSTGAVIWQKTYPGGDKGCVRGVEVLSDGSIVATGYINSGEGGYVFIADDSDGFIMKTDSSGTIIWDKSLSVAQGTKVREISTGFAVCSCAWYYDGGDHMDAVLIKTDSNGTETYSNHYGSTSDEHVYDFDLTSDGGYVFGGHTMGYGVANWDFYLLKVDSSGNEEWYKTFGQPRGYDATYIFDECYGVRQTSDGGYVMAGGSGDEDSGYSDCSHPCECSDVYVVEVVKTDSNGTMEWQGVYPCTENPGNNAGEYIDLTSDGGYIVFADSDAFMGTIGAEALAFIKLAGEGPPDTEPPTPDPMTWATVPYATGTTTIAMEATTATDQSGVEYYFSCTSGGGHDSDWQDDTYYEDTDLQAATEYCYTVKARDKSPNQNQTAESAVECATTLESDPEMYVNDIAMTWYEPKSNYYAARATVWIKDEYTGDVDGATVTGAWSGATTSGDTSGETGQDGKVTLESKAVKGGGTFTFTVTDVSATGFTYNAALNVMDSNSVTAP